MTGIKKFVVALLYYPKQYLKKLIAFLISIVKVYSLYRFFFLLKTNHTRVTACLQMSI